MKSDGKGGVVCWAKNEGYGARFHWDNCKNGLTLTFDPQTKQISLSDGYRLAHASKSADKDEAKVLGKVPDAWLHIAAFQIDPTMAQWQENKVGGLSTLHDPKECVIAKEVFQHHSFGFVDCAATDSEYSTWGTQYYPPPGVSDAVMAAAGAPKMTPPAPAATSAPTNAPTGAQTHAPTSAPTNAPKAIKSVARSGSSPSGSGTARVGTKKNPGLKGVNTAKPQQPHSKSTAKMSGDPHIVTWSGNKFDFHGACDLIFIHVPEFANGLGLDIHVRTKGEKWWSFIQTAVLKIGDDTLEVAGGANGGNFWLNGVAGDELMDEDAFHVSLFQVTHRRSSNKQRKFRIDLGGNGAIAFETFKNFVSVVAKAKDPNSFQGAVGLMGRYPTGEMVGRDGTTVLEDPIAFGLEWQVLSSEPMLFHDLGEGVHHPEVCALPSLKASAQRRLGESMKKEDAEAACAHVDEFERDACIFDVLATNDKDMADGY